MTISHSSSPPQSPSPVTPAVVGARARKFRKAAGLKLLPAAHASGLAISSLMRIEHGEGMPRLSTLLALAQLYRVDIGALIGPPTPAELAAAEEKAAP